MVVKIVVYEDNKRLRESLLLLLENDHQYKVVGSFANCITASEDIRATQPDLVLMDIDMPGITGIEGVKIIKEHFPDVKIVMHTVFENSNAYRIRRR